MLCPGFCCQFLCRSFSLGFTSGSIPCLSKSLLRNGPNFLTHGFDLDRSCIQVSRGGSSFNIKLTFIEYFIAKFNVNVNVV